jgi:uncharacterized membrane protein
VSIGPVSQVEEGGWSKRKLRTALLCSLAVNLLGVGLIAGAFIAGPPHVSRGEFGLKGFSHTLPKDRGEVLRQSFQQHRPKIRELREAARAARLEATSVLVAEPYDKAKLRASLTGIDEAESKLRSLVSDYFIDAAEKLTPQERVALGEWWKQRQPRLFWRGGEPGKASAPENGATKPK